MNLISSDAKTAIIVLLIIVLAVVLIRLSGKSKFKQTTYKSDSGDRVKSRAELIIANWLFYRGIEFIYEKRTPTKERVVSDFYLTQSGIYIEFWGLETSQYLKRKKEKRLSQCIHGISYYFSFSCCFNLHNTIRSIFKINL